MATKHRLNCWTGCAGILVVLLLRGAAGQAAEAGGFTIEPLGMKVYYESVEITLTGTNFADHQAQIAAWLVQRYPKLDPKSVECDILSGTLAVMIKSWDTKPHLLKRDFNIVADSFKSYQGIAAKVDQTAMPPEFRDVLKGYYAAVMKKAIRLDDVAEGRRLATIPPDSQVVRVAPGETFRKHIVATLPEFEKLPPLCRAETYRALAGFNPNLQRASTYRVSGVAVSEPLEHVQVPLGGGHFQVTAYRVAGDGRMLLPSAAGLARLGNPSVLDLKGTWIRDLSVLQDLSPAALDVSYSPVSDIRPLAGLRRSLRRLNLAATGVTDLSPLQGMSLESLDISGTQVADLSPLAGMPLTELSIADTRVTDFSFLPKLPLGSLNLAGTPLRDLSLLRGLKLASLNLERTDVRDFMALKGMPLESFWYPVRGEFSGLEVFREIAGLKTINDVPAAQWIQKLTTGKADAKPPPQAEVCDDP